MSRAKAFDKPFPSDWRPSLSDRVYVASIDGTRTKNVSTGIVVAKLPEDCFKIQLRYSGRVFFEIVSAHQMRPYKKRRSTAK